MNRKENIFGIGTSTAKEYRTLNRQGDKSSRQKTISVFKLFFLCSQVEMSLYSRFFLAFQFSL